MPLGIGMQQKASEPYTRRVSFVERYVIERASTFRLGHEKEDAWSAVLSAQSIYNIIQQQGERAERELALEQQKAAIQTMGMAQVSASNKAGASHVSPMMPTLPYTVSHLHDVYAAARKSGDSKLAATALEAIKRGLETSLRTPLPVDSTKWTGRL